MEAARSPTDYLNVMVALDDKLSWLNEMTDCLQFFCLDIATLLHLLYGAFPNHKAADSMALQRFPNKQISADIAIELLLPELNPAFRHISVLASAMPMPVTAMNENGDLE